MVGGISPRASDKGTAQVDVTPRGRRLRAVLARHRSDGPGDAAHADESWGRAQPTPAVDVPAPRSSLEQLAALERLRGKPADVALGPLLRGVVCEVPRLLVELIDCDVEVYAHDDDLRTVLRNLLMNVRDHADGRAVVACRTEDRRVRVTIADAGPGLRPLELATLFQRGARGPGSPGLGLGLHVARLLCRRQGGDLQLLRSVGGCTFEIVLWTGGGPNEAGVLPAQRCGRGAPAPSSSAKACEG